MLKPNFVFVMLRWLALSFLLLGAASAAQAAIPASERTVLTNLYDSTNGPSWTINTRWKGDVGSECTWYGVTCDGAQTHVIYIGLGNNHLVGILPSLSGLPALNLFQVASNQLSGPIPSLSGLTALQFFYADNNQLSGPIPSLSGLTTLQFFYVNKNQLTGPVAAAPTSLVRGGSNLCGNSLVSSGNPTIDAAWVTAAGNWLACQTLH